MKQQPANKKVLTLLIVVFGLIVLGLVGIYAIGLFGEPKNPQGISNEQDCREAGGKVLEGQAVLCQLPGEDSFEVKD